MSSKTIELPLFERITSFHKFLISLFIGIVTYFVIELQDTHPLIHVMLGWDVFCLAMIIMSWITFFQADDRHIRQIAGKQDPKRAIVFAIILIATLAGMFAVLLLIMAKKDGSESTDYKTPIAVAGMLLSWFLIHTTFTFRYAHIFYGDNKNDKSTHAGGLEFPEDDKPDYLDFAYFSFVLGMTFQVSDIQITSKRFRKLALLHGLISFSFSTVMIALTINVIGS
ncbi:MAG: DUF1345 domain-containing protein [Ginsengibacter sp.]|jgi:uncharacterized membrane protein